MSKFGLILGGLEEISFKRAQDGWVFRSPSIWPRRTYLVTDAKKAAPVKPLRRMLMVQFVMIIVQWRSPNVSRAAMAGPAPCPLALSWGEASPGGNRDTSW